MNRAGRVAGIAACIYSALALSACGGGGGGGGSSPMPTVTLSANPPTTFPGGTTQLTWSSTDATSCSASGGWGGQQPTSGTSAASVPADTTFTLTCRGNGGSASASVTVAARPLPNISISVVPQVVRPGQTAEITWAVTDATTCDASGGWSGARAVSGNETVGPIAAGTQYNLTCTGPSGTVMAGTNLGLRFGTNVQPVADAGADQTVNGITLVQLDGSRSHDDFAIASVSWSQLAGPAVTLSNPSASTPSFTSPDVATDTLLTFALTVTDDEGAPSAPDTVNITVQPIPATVAIGGSLGYERVPNSGNRLEYGFQFVDPLDAEVLVEALDASTSAVLASGRFARNFQLMVPSRTSMVLRVTANIDRQAPDPLPHWQIAIRDLDDAGTPLGPVYSYTAAVFDSGGGGTHSIVVPSGWNSAGQLIGARLAAPFAVLDSVQQGIQRILSVEPDADFPPLTIDWSPTNAGGVTFFNTDVGGQQVIVLAGERDVDTDEYDPTVILHEFGHYIDHAFSRADSPGGPHALGDRLDMRLAFGEGIATAFGAIAYDDSLYSDSFGVGQLNASAFSVENDSTVNEGWYSEQSVQELIWDIYDTLTDSGDTLDLGFQPIWDVWHSPAQRDTEAFTSIFTFMSAFRQSMPFMAPALDTMLANEQIVGPTIDIYGSTETNTGFISDTLPIYAPIALSGSVHVRSTNEAGTPNKLGSHRYLRFSLAAPSNVRIDETAGAGRDPDIGVYLRGVNLAPVMGPTNESFTLSLAAGDYVLDVYDCGNADCNPGVLPGSIDITVSLTPN